MGRDPQGDGGEGFTCLGSIVFGRGLLQMGSEESHQVAGNRAIAAVPMGKKAALVLDELLPGLQQLLCLPLAVGQCRPATAHRLVGEAGVCQGWDNGSATEEELAAKQHPQQVEEAQVGSDIDTCEHPRQNGVDTVD